jgi:site-specific DNA recombinase
MADIERGHIDCVVVYKVDRLSRSLLDFARMMELFERHKVSFVAVTQQINTGTSMGRLMLNVLLSFAQFERELVSERTRDKIAAARRKGKWAGGHTLLGYDVVKSPGGTKLKVNPGEAKRVRQIFRLYLKHKGLIPLVQELDSRGWVTKRWTTSKGRVRGGGPFNKSILYMFLRNPLYVGKVAHKDNLYDGQHAAIVSPSVFTKVQKLLDINGRGGGLPARNQHSALLKGLLRCKPCGCSMGATYSGRAPVRYRYYLCLNAAKRGWANCSSKAVPAIQMEQFVLEKLRNLDGTQLTPEQRIAIKELESVDVISGVYPAAFESLRTLIEHIEYDGVNGTVALTLKADELQHPRVRVRGRVRGRGEAA